MSSTSFKLYRSMALLLLAGVLVLGVLFNLFLYHYVMTNSEDELTQDAENMAELSMAYYSVGLLGQNVKFKTSVSVAAKMSGTDTLICDDSGIVVICSDSVQGCEHLNRKLESAYVSRAFENGHASSTSMLSGVYSEKRLAVAIPLMAGSTRLGLVVTSVDLTDIDNALSKTTLMFLAVAAAVTVATLIFMLIAARRQDQPLRELAAAARQLGHGNLEVRLETGPKNTREYNELAVAFNNMAAGLQTTESQRQEFVANISHELKTPMTTIAGYMDGMLDGTIPASQHPYYMQIVSDEVRRLSRLVRSMLDISRMQSKGVDESRKSRFDLSDVLGQVLIGFEPRIGEKDLDVQVDLPDASAYTFADRDAITQVVYNLLDNAIKFCNPGGLLGVQLWCQGGKINVAISNTGETISPEELPLVFERFHKTDKSRSRNPDGAGLGLYIVKTIICGHGEDITVESKDGKTVFVFTLPQMKSKGKEESDHGSTATEKPMAAAGGDDTHGTGADSGDEPAQ